MSTTATASGAVVGGGVMATLAPMLLAGAAGAALMCGTVAMSKGQKRNRRARRLGHLQMRVDGFERDGAGQGLVDLDEIRL